MSLAKLLLPYRARKRICFQILSDLHLEVDIGRLADYEAFRDFLRSQCEKFKQVYLVLGNHEFFGVSRQEGLCLASTLPQEPGLKGRLIVMNQKRVDLQDVTLLGCTLQSHIPPEAKDIVRQKINDFLRIFDWTVENHNTEHANDVKWLADEISSIRMSESGSKRKIVVITHHAPLTKGTSKPTDKNNPWSSAFGTDLLGREEGSCLDGVQWWISGHTHYSTELITGKVKLVSNQRGCILPNTDDDGREARAKFTSRVLLKVWDNVKQKQGTFDPEKTIEV
ncbi:hypothetical protein AJ79_06645 [Helicocarpus griseus UAMH5409]|uniref:Calcineurin-like phosphoesterase domain-containing protein n=1 Tax=Helicocarpus griseus UAMH5409 TaxID=1447875 RepID=A0A2B7XA25_9EURO|nr:hypothetical protein AJ79_06645 [Helicocarpus griseus UAMH5409]